MNAYHRWRRGVNRRLSPHFTSREFDCDSCVCAMQSISEELVNRLELVRQEYGAAIMITGAYRCARKQEILRGTLPPGHTAVGRSTHEDGNAVDVRGQDMPKLLIILEKHFKAIGTAKTFFHVDLRADKVRRWKYE